MLCVLNLLPFLEVLLEYSVYPHKQICTIFNRAQQSHTVGFLKSSKNNKKRNPENIEELQMRINNAEDTVSS